MAFISIKSVAALEINVMKYKNNGKKSKLKNVIRISNHMSNYEWFLNEVILVRKRVFPVQYFSK